MKHLFLFLLIASRCFAQFNIGDFAFQAQQNASGGTPLNFTNILLADSPNMLFFFNDASGRITDYAGTNTFVSVPAGITLGKTGLILADSITSANDSGSAQLSLTNALFNSFVTNSTFSYEFIFVQTNSRSGTSFYQLVAKQNSSNVGYIFQLVFNNSGVSTPDGTIIPATWMSVRFQIVDGSANKYWASAACDVSNSTTNHIVITYTNMDGTPFSRIWVNANLIEIAETVSGTVGIVTNSVNLAIFNKSVGGGGFTGNIQLAASYTNVLTEVQVLTHYLASIGQSYQPNSHIYNHFVGLDATGTKLQLFNTCVLWVASSNLYYIYGMGTLGVNSNGNMNQTNVYCYSTPSLAAGTFTPLGICLSTTGMSPLYGNNRPSVVYNAASNYFVMWLKAITNSAFLNNHVVYISTSPTPAGPFSIINSNYLPTGSTTIGDFAVRSYSNDASAFVYYRDVSTPTNMWIGQLNSSFTSITGTRSPMFTNTSALNTTVEAPCPFFLNGTYFVLVSPQESYNPIRMTNVFYGTSLSPIGPFNALASVFTNNPFGSGYEFQTCSGVINLAADTNRWLLFGDYYQNGALQYSSVAVNEITFTTSSNIVINPTKVITLP